MDDNFKSYYKNLNLNKFRADCLRITEKAKKVELKPPMDVTPEVFVISNRFYISYGDEGSLEKKNINYKATKNSIEFDIVADDKDKTGVPICYLAYEKSD